MKQIRENRILYRALTLSKLIALLAVAFLLSATLDEVPDCPELLNSSRGQVASLQLGHAADFAAAPSVSYLDFLNVPPRVTARLQDFGEILAIAPQSLVSRYVYQSADPSPPST
ncbi:MAG TPA: hypothetical protein VK604_03200 [Bryobacteraceae bacterium]|nr:hypothetical protein [Bryobacteraceae bacterium]